MNRMKVRFGLQFLLLICVFFAYVPVSDAAVSVTAKKIIATQTSFTLSIGASKQLNAVVSPSTTTNKKLTWTTSNKNVATVTTAGKVTAITQGIATITARNAASGKYVNFQITVVPRLSTTISVKSIILNQPVMALPVGEKGALVARILPVNATDKSIVWKSSNSQIASVDSTGVVTAIAAGEAIITAENLVSKVSAQSQVNVIKPILSAEEVFAKVNPAVVKIEMLNKKNEVIGSGSGVIMRSDGIVLTNFHVISDISGPVMARIILEDGTTTFLTDTVLGYDAARDLAVLKINEKILLPSVEIVSRVNPVNTGSVVYALGSPNGIQNAMTAGEVTNKTFYFESSYPFLAHSAPLYPGNSGGALVNAYGEVVGINDAVVTQGRQSIYLAIPIEAYAKLDLSTQTTIGEINRKFYVPLTGEGTVTESEPNDDLETSNAIPFLKSKIVGQIQNRFDYDGFMFNLTEEATMQFSFSMIDQRFNDYVGLVVVDGSGNLIARSQMSYSSATGESVLQAKVTLSPGAYWLVVTPSTYRSNAMRNASYLGEILFTPTP